MTDNGAHSDKDRIRRLSRSWRNHAASTTNDGPIDVTIGLSCSFTDQGVVELVGGLLLDSGYAKPTVVASDYNQIISACLNHVGTFGPNAPDLIAVAFRLEDLAPSDDARVVAEAAEATLAAIRHLRANYQGTIVLGMPPRPRSSNEGLSAFSRSSPLTAYWYSVCAKICELAQSHARIYTIDIEELIGRLGEADSLSPRDDMLYRQPYSPKLQLKLAERIVRFQTIQTREPKKCIVLDCDNTLWGGIIGEDGVSGVALSDDFPGRPFREFQRQLKALRETGVMLAVCSKNNPCEVDEMFESHSAMVLTKSDISAWQVNWEPKSSNLKKIAETLNIGLDSLVFIDDSPFEIDEVATNAAGVTCLLLPDDTVSILTLLKGNYQLFDRLEITAEDAQRVAMMQHEVSRMELAQTLAPEDYLASLDLRIKIMPVGEGEISRVVQLVNKTNQFNVTTKRYTTQEISDFVKDPKSDVYCVSVEDRFGEYGIVGVAILLHSGQVSYFDTLLLSCRVLARGVESAIIGFGIEQSRRRGSSAIVGEVIETRKNGMVADLFERHGFELTASQEGKTTFTRATHPLDVPVYLHVSVVGSNDFVDA